MVWAQLSHIQGGSVLDFGSGRGFTASHLAARNRVVAVEPDPAMRGVRVAEHPYTQLAGSTDVLREMEGACFDTVVCHNVLEYAPDRADIMAEFARLLKRGGTLSLLKHNRNGA